MIRFLESDDKLNNEGIKKSDCLTMGIDIWEQGRA